MEDSLVTLRNQLPILEEIGRKSLLKNRKKKMIKRKRHFLMKIVIVFIGDVRRHIKKLIMLIRSLVGFILGDGILDQLERQ